MNKPSQWRQHISARLRGLSPAREAGPPREQNEPEPAEARGPDPEQEQERARRGRLRLAVAGALFATLVLPRVADVPGYSGAAAQPTPSSSASSVPAYPPESPGGTPSPSSPSSSPSLPGPSVSRPLATPPGEPPSPGASGPESESDDSSLARAFRSVEAGQCLTVHSDGTTWSRPAPTAATRVGCGDDRAYVRVTAVRRDAGGACPAGNGRAAWTRGGISLCLTRQFRVGQCLLAESGDGQVRAALMSAPACSDQRPSGKYDRLLTVTAVHDADDPASGSCHDDDRSKGGEHARYWTWKVDGEARTLCAADATE